MRSTPRAEEGVSFGLVFKSRSAFRRGTLRERGGLGGCKRWRKGLSPLSGGNGMGQIHGHTADLGCGSCLVLRPKYLKEETVVTKEPSASSGDTSSHPTMRGVQDTQEQSPSEVPVAVSGISGDSRKGLWYQYNEEVRARLSIKARVQNDRMEGALGLETHGTVALSRQRSESFTE